MCDHGDGVLYTYDKAAYKSAKGAEERKDALLTREREEEFTEHNYQKAENQLDTVRFSFQKDDRGNYGLTSVTFVH